jgi:putative spermidine/putrescine transport system ATP-binding protein
VSSAAADRSTSIGNEISSAGFPADEQSGLAMQTAVAFSHVSRHFGSVRAVDGVDLEIAEGEFFAMLGPSGSGKTTCLRLIAGFEQPTSGHIEIFSETAEGVPPYRRNVNTVFQDYALFPHLSVADNVAYGLMIRGVAKSERLKAADDALALVQLPGYGDRKPSQLSGGQRQRVALARALVNKPKVLLLDEPLGALDLKLREQMQEELKALQRTLGITFVFVTHDQGEALSMADRVAVFNDGQIMQIGSPEDIYQRPRSRFVADFVGSSNILPPDVTELLGGDRAWASLRPEAIRLANEGGHVVTVTGHSYLGAVTRLSLDLEGVRLTALVPAGTAIPETGATIRIAWDAADLHKMEDGA